MRVHVQCVLEGFFNVWAEVDLEKSVARRLAVPSIVGELLCDVHSALLPSR